MATTIFRTAHSTVVRDAMDFSAVALRRRTGRTVAQAVSVPFHLGSIPAAMETLLEHFGERIRPGDVYIINDPFDGGRHLPDIFVFKPVHLGGELIGFTSRSPTTATSAAGCRGRAPATTPRSSRKGSACRGCKLYAEGEPVEDVFKIIEANVRIPRMTFGDLGAQVAACSVASARCVELAERHGTEQLAELMDALIDHTERLVRQEIASWPDGTASFTDYLDSDGIDVCDVPITAHVTIAGDEVIADFPTRRRWCAARSTARRRSSRRASTTRCARPDDRDPAHRRRLPADHGRHEARDGHPRRDAGRLLDARRDRATGSPTR